MLHVNNIYTINKIINKKRYSELLEYCDFDWSCFYILSYFMKNIPNDIFIHLISNTINLEYQDHNGWRPIHHACRYQTKDVIQLLIDKGVNLECRNNSGWRPIHHACRYQTKDVVQLIIDKGVNLEYRDC